MFKIHSPVLAEKTVPKFQCPVAETTQDPTAGPCAAVGILFIPNENPQDPAQVVLTERSLNVASHKGQISFPGGFYEQSDQSLEETVKREIEEEIGVPRHHLYVHGCLNSFTSLHKVQVYPLIMSAAVAQTDFAPNEEVAQLHLLPWTELVQSKIEFFAINNFGTWRKTPLIKIRHKNLWGLTAHILHHCNFTA